MEQIPQTHVEPIISLRETLALMAQRPGITVGGGIEMNTPNPDPKAAEPPKTEDDMVATYRIKEWMDRQRERDKAAETIRKKLAVVGDKYIKPLRWTEEERARLNGWRRQYGIAPTGTGMTGKRVGP